MITKRNLTLNTFNTDPITYRGIADSTELNTILNSLKTNAYNCILRSRKTAKKLDNLRNAYVYLNQYMASKMLDLNYKADQILNYSASGLHSSTISMYDYNVTQSGVLSNVKVDTNYGQMTLDIDYSWSKIPKYTDYLGDKKPTPDVKIYVDDVEKDSTDSAYDCLDSLGSTLWIESTTYEDHVIKFKMPVSLKPKINALKLDFFPQYSCVIKKIEYYSIKGTWEELSNYESDGKSIYMHFNPYDYDDQVRITIKPISDLYPIIGIGNFDLYLINYVNAGSATFKFPELEKLTITSLNNLKVDYYIDNYSTANQFSTNNPMKVYLIIDSDSYEIPYNVINGTNGLNLNVGTITNKEIKIKFDMTEINMTSPVIRGATLIYSV